MNPAIGVTQWFLPGAGAYTLALAHELGFDAVQLELGRWEDGFPISSPMLQKLYLEDSRRLNLRLLPLALNDLCGHPMTEGFGTPDGQIARAVLETGIQTAAAMGLEGVTVPNFGRNRILSREHYEYTVEALQFACERAQTMRLKVYTENVLTAQEQTGLFADVGYDNLLLLFDSENYHHAGRDCAPDVLKTHAGRIGSHVHVKAGGEDRSCCLGEGEGPFGEIMQLLRDMQYAGVIVTENQYQKRPEGHPELTAEEWIRQDLQVIRSGFHG